MSQTFKDFEIIIVDDGSSDRTVTVEVISKFKGPRIKVIALKENQGAIVACQIGFEHSTGQYITYLTTDDAYVPHKLAKLVAFLDQNPHIGSVFSTADIIDEEGDPFHGTHPYTNVLNVQNRSRFAWLSHFFIREIAYVLHHR